MEEAAAEHTKSVVSFPFPECPFLEAAKSEKLVGASENNKEYKNFGTKNLEQTALIPIMRKHNLQLQLNRQKGHFMAKSFAFKWGYLCSTNSDIRRSFKTMDTV